MYHVTLPFIAHKSVFVSMFTELYSHHHNLILEHFCHPLKETLSPWAVTPPYSFACGCISVVTLYFSGPVSLHTFIVLFQEEKEAGGRGGLTCVRKQPEEGGRIQDSQINCLTNVAQRWGHHGPRESGLLQFRKKGKGIRGRTQTGLIFHLYSLPSCKFQLQLCSLAVNMELN